MNLPDIQYTGGTARIIETQSQTGESIQFYKDANYFQDISTYNKFVIQVQKMVYASEEYKNFCGWIRKSLGINFCQVNSSIVENDGVTIEMHHGPIFTLFDYISVMLNSYIDNGIPISTFNIVDEVIEEHYQRRVQVVMLSTTNHEAVHNGDIFLNFKQGIGNFSEFVTRYSKYFTDEQKYRIASYLKLCEDNDSFDTGILDIENVSKMVQV